MYNLGHLGLYKNIPKKRIFNPTPNYERDAYTLLQYKSHLRNEFLIPLKANGDGTGVATIRLQSLETQSIKITGNGKFYTSSAGTTEAGIESTIGTSLTSFFVKVPAGESCYLVLGKADKLSGLGSNAPATSVIGDGANIPYIYYCAINYPLINLSVIMLSGALNSSFTGSIDNTPNLTYLNFFNNVLVSLTGSIDNTPNITYISIFKNQISKFMGDIGKATKLNFLNFEFNTESQLTYVTPRNTIDKWPNGRLNLILLSMTSMTSAMCDSLLIDIDASGATPITLMTINLSGLCGAVTSASAAAIASLMYKGFIVIVNNT